MSIRHSEPRWTSQQGYGVVVCVDIWSVSGNAAMVMGISSTAKKSLTVGASDCGKVVVVGTV